jgi:hypothetical protein
LNYKLFDCVPDKNKKLSGIKSLIEIYSDLLKRPHFEPVLILEDDVMITDSFRSTVEIPEDADCVYLGLADIYSSFTNIPTVSWIHVNHDKLVRITDMLTTHAYIICSETWLRILLKSMQEILENPTHYDIPIAQKMKDYVIYAYKKPYFYQYGPAGGLDFPTDITLNDISSRVFFTK